MRAVTTTAPEPGHLVQARGQQWLVTEVTPPRLPVDELAATRVPGSTLVRLASVSDDDLGDELTLVWEIEPNRQILPATELPPVTRDGWDDPATLGAFLDAVRWGTVASADERTLQAPFRSGITIEEYQLEPVARALRSPRVNLLIADDVGLGKTIEAGLVAQELLLRHRARRIVVCPAPLTLKWQAEVQEKFGLEFVVLTAAQLAELRRSHGLQANPFSVYPRIVISLPWLRTPRVQRLLDEVLTPQTRHPGFVDLLVVDEAHHCAPPAPCRGKGYAVDSQQTRAVRRLGEHSRHRLFLSATPHNGHRESWQALLEILDPQRFARGVDPDPAAVAQVMVRRLKDSLVDADGAPRFPRRVTEALEVPYTDTERHGHALLDRYLTLRRRAARRRADDGGTRGNDLVALLLKKRMFSSPAAFARTLDVHRASLRGDVPAPTGDLGDWDDPDLEWDAPLADDESGDEAAADLLARVATSERGLDAAEAEALADLSAWSDAHAEPADSKARRLLDELRTVVEQFDERVIVFTEWRDTQTWLAEILAAHGLGGDRLGLLFGGLDPGRREHLKAAFQADPTRDPVRILLATDSASEGIDLQRHCRRVIHYDIPFNPNRLEQRIGRVDRHGQRREVLVRHFVGAGWRDAPPGSHDGDLEFLSRVARKVATEREDLGSVNPVLARAVEHRMLGRPTFADPLEVRASPGARSLKAERDLADQVRRLRDQLDGSRARLRTSPANVRRVVNVALALAAQPALVDAPGDGEVRPPVLTRGWERTVTDLADPLDGRPRPLTFDPAVAAGRDDVVLAHLEHPLVRQATALLRSAVWGRGTLLHRVGAVRAEMPPGTDVDGLLVTVFARLVVVGADGARLHEEVLLAGRSLPGTGRSARLDLEAPRNAAVREAVESALDPSACRPAPGTARARLADAWPELRDLLARDVQVRADQVIARLQRRLDDRAAAERDRVTAVLDQLADMLRAALATDATPQLELDLLADERAQYERDRAAWQARLDALPADRARELAQVDARYSGRRPLVFPFAVALVVPDGWRA